MGTAAPKRAARCCFDRARLLMRGARVHTLTHVAVPASPCRRAASRDSGAGARPGGSRGAAAAHHHALPHKIRKGAGAGHARAAGEPSAHAARVLAACTESWFWLWLHTGALLQHASCAGQPVLALCGLRARVACAAGRGIKGLRVHPGIEGLRVPGNHECHSYPAPPLVSDLHERTRHGGGGHRDGPAGDCVQGAAREEDPLHHPVSGIRGCVSAVDRMRTRSCAKRRSPSSSGEWQPDIWGCIKRPIACMHGAPREEDALHHPVRCRRCS